MVLENLDTVPWGQLHHAYGSAEDVPGLLRELLSSDTEALEETYDSLFSNIWHQGTVYEATAYAVPFLVELLQYEPVLMKEVILNLLDCIAHGSSYHNVHVREPEKRHAPEMQSKIAEELRHVQAAHEAVRQSLSLYLQVLRGTDISAASSAASLLTKFPEDYPVVVPALVLAVEDSANAELQVVVMMNLRDLLVKVQQLPGDMCILCRTCAAQMIGNGAPVVRLAAAHLMLKVGERDEFANALSLLMDALVHPAAYKPGGAWQRNPADEAEILSALPDSPDDSVVSALMTVLAQAQEDVQAHHLAIKLLTQAFGSSAMNGYGVALSQKNGVKQRMYWSSPRREASRRQTLDNRQRTVIRALLENDAFWQIQTNLLEIFGLPASRADVRRFLQRV